MINCVSWLRNKTFIVKYSQSESEVWIFVYEDDIYDTKTYSDPGSEEYTSQFGAVASEADTYRSDSRHPPAKYLQWGVREQN